MKNARPLVVVLVSVIVGAAAIAVAARWVAGQANIATTQVVVAERDIDAGTKLRPDMVQVAGWPAGTPLKDPISDTGKVIDRVVTAQVMRGEPILAAKLAAPGEQGGLSAVLTEGRRAITVRVNEIVGVAGFALPGNYVDVMVNASDEANKPISKIVLERILVLAVAQDAGTGDNKPRLVNAVTLEVTPQQAEQLDLARSIGSLSLVLRSQVDKAASATTGARRNDLLKLGPAAADRPAVVAKAEATAEPRATPVTRAAAPARRPAVAAPAVEERVEVIRGMKKSAE